MTSTHRWQFATLCVSILALVLYFRGRQPSKEASKPPAQSIKTEERQSVDQAYVRNWSDLFLARLSEAKTPRMICDVLWDMSDTADTRVLDSLRTMLDSSNEEVAQCASGALSKVRSIAALEILAAHLDNDAIRPHALLALATSTRPDMLERVKAAADNANPKIAFDALSAMAINHIPGTLERLKAIAPLVPPEKQYALLHAIANTREPGALQTLINMPRHGAAFRERGFHIIAALQTPEAAAYLRSLVPTISQTDQSELLEALVSIGDRESIDLVLGFVRHGTPKMIVDALDALRHSMDSHVSDVLLPLLNDPRPSTIAAVVEVIAAQRDKRAVPALERLTKVNDRAIAGQAFKALFKIDSERATALGWEILEKSTDAVDDWILVAMRDSGADRDRLRALCISRAKAGLVRGRTHAVPVAFSILAEDSSPEARDVLIRVAQSQEAAADGAFEALAYRQDETSANALAQLILSTTNEDLLHARMDHLSDQFGEHVGQSARQALVRLSREATGEMRVLALEMLIENGGTEAQTAIEEALVQQDPKLREQGAVGVALQPGEGALARLQSIANDPTNEVALVGRAALAARAPEQAEPFLWTDLKSNDASVRQRAFAIAEHLPSTRNESLLRAGLNDTDPRIRLRAGLALVDRDPSLAASLGTSVRDPSVPLSLRLRVLRELREDGLVSAAGWGTIAEQLEKEAADSSDDDVYDDEDLTLPEPIRDLFDTHRGYEVAN